MDTGPGILHAVNETIYVCDLSDVSQEEKNSMIGPPIDRSFARIWSLPEEKAQEAAAKFRMLYAEKYLLEATPYPGVLTLLNGLRAAGWKVGVATYKRNDYAQRVMKETGITDACDFVLGSDGEKQTKADIIRICLHELKETAGHAIMVGDTLHDLKGAQDVGLLFLGVSYGYGFKTKDEILKNGAKYAAASAEEVGNVLMRLQA